MIKKLPIIIDFEREGNENNIGKIIFHNFVIKIINGMIEIDVINPYNNLNFIKVPCVNKYNCIHYLKISLPLKIKIINNKLLFPYFFVVKFNSYIDNELDFFINLLKYIKIFNKKYEYFSLSDYKDKANDVYLYLRNITIKNKFVNFSDYLKNMYTYINYHKNFYLMLSYLDTINVDLRKYNFSKKVLNNLILLTNKKFSFKESSKYTLKEHIINFKDNKVKLKDIVKDNYYFLLVNNKKNLRVSIKNVNNDLINLENNNIKYNKYKILYYPDNMNELLNIDSLFNYYSLLNFDNFIVNKLWSKPKLEIYKTLLEYFNDDSFNIYNFKIFNKIDLKIDNYEKDFEFIKDKYSYDFYLFYSNNIKSKLFDNSINKIKDKKKKIELLNFMFTKYTFPFKYNRRELNDTFLKIILFSLLNYKLIIDFEGPKMFLKKDSGIELPIKLKSLYFNLLKIYHDYCNDSFDNIIYNPKLYTDPIHYDVLKILFETKNPISKLFKFNKNKFNNFKNIIKKVTLITQICNNLNWRNVSKKLVYLNELIENKKLVFYNEKLNKNIVPLNFDNRLKKIVINPFEMFKYLRKEKDYIKWIYFLDKKITDLYNTTIIVKEEKYENLGKLIFLLLNIKSQNLDDDSYIYFLDYCNKNNELILINSRINLKIKECFRFLKININLGYLAKHLTWDNGSILSNKTNRLKDLEDKIKSISKKYYKYKGKYIQLKRETESSISILSSKINS
jgi:hypothetical protein